jgi:hypothetical protein
MEICPKCKTKVNVITTGSVDTIISEAYDDALGICVRNKYFHIKGRRVQCIKCRKEFLIIRHRKELTLLED